MSLLESFMCIKKFNFMVIIFTLLSAKKPSLEITKKLNVDSMII